MTKVKALFLVMAASIFIISCTGNKEPEKISSWEWLPQNLQDTAIFAPGIISDTGRFELSITFTPDGDTCFFAIHTGRIQGRNNWAIMYSVFANGNWTTPDTCSFSGKFPDYGPYMSPDGSALYFSSRRPVHDTGTVVKGDYDLWMVKRNGNDWDKPVRLADGINTNNEEYGVAVTNKNLYICARRYDSLGRTDYFIVPVSEQFNSFSSIHNLGNPPNDDMWEGNLYVNPDETMMVMQHLVDGENESEQIKVSYKTDTGWSKPKLLNGTVNTKEHEIGPYVSPDGKFVFVGRNREIVIANLDKAKE